MKHVARLLLLALFSTLALAQEPKYTTPAWLASINFEPIQKVLDADPNALPLANWVRHTARYWATNTFHPPHVSGGFITEDKREYKYDLYILVDNSLEAVVHLGGDRDQTLKIRAWGSWYALDENHNFIGHGKDAIVKPHQ